MKIVFNGKKWVLLGDNGKVIVITRIRSICEGMMKNDKQCFSNSTNGGKLYGYANDSNSTLYFSDYRSYTYISSSVLCSNVA